MKKNIKELIATLSSGPVRRYIEDHENEDITKIILKHKEILGIPAPRLIEQIASRRKAREKLPLYYNTKGIIFPPPENLEQSSSERAARYKTKILEALLDPAGLTGADLTGGFGVDTFFLSRGMSLMHYVETDPSLVQLAAHSHRLLGAKNIIYHPLTAEEFLHASAPIDFVYVDPSRRDDGKKIQALEQSQPDIIKLADQVFSRAKWLMVKASPLFDIRAGTERIPYVREVYVVSIDNECKELLFWCERGFSSAPRIHAVNISDRDEVFTFTFREEQQQKIDFSEPLGYLYEPNASILKAGAFKTVAVRCKVQKIQPNTHLYTSNEQIDIFPGRKFLVEALIKPDASHIKKYFPDGKANVTTRNYPLSVEALKKKAGLRDGGDKYLIGFSGLTKKYLAVARRL